MKQWEFQPSPSLGRSLPENLTVFPREKDMTCTVVRVAWNMLMRMFLKVYLRLSIEGRENLPLHQSYVFVANHASHLDAVCLSAALPIASIDRAFSVAAKDYFFANSFRSLCSSVLVNALPFDRKANCRGSLELCADVLNVADQVLIMFPEGTRTLTGQVQPFKKGVGILAAGSDRLIVPAYIDGAFDALPKGAHVPKPKHVRVLIGKPMSFRDATRDEQGYLEVANACQRAVEDLQPKGERNE